MIDFSIYSKPALQFSGGKDSLACLYLLQGQLDKITVYWVNTGDACPETARVVSEVREWVPKFVEVKTDAAAWRDQYGIPSDVVPANGHFLGLAYGLGKLRVSNRFDCCFFNLMQPLHQRMVVDAVDVVIRGTKLSDTGKLPHEGKSEFYDVVLPLRDWTNDQVFAYLAEVGAPRNEIYEHFKGISAPECLGCTAWWDDNKASYLKSRHPEKHVEYVVKLQAIRAELASHLRELETELEI